MDLSALVEALERARPGGVGVRAWSLRRSHSRHASLGVKDGQTGNAHAPFALSESTGVHYLLVWGDGRVSRGAWERRQVEHGLDRAVDEARLAAYDDPDAAQVVGPAILPDVELHDAAAAGAALGDGREIADRLDAVRQIVAQRAFRTWSGSFAAGESVARVATSAGFDASTSGTSVSWHVRFNGEIGDGFGARRAESQTEFLARLARLASLAEELARDAARGTDPVDTVLLHPRVVEEYVVETLLANLDGAAVAHGQSHFERSRFGSDAPVLRDDIELRVDPLLPFRLGSYACTGEGVPACPTTLIERGRLVLPVLDLKYAKRLGLAPTAQPQAMDSVCFGGARAISYAEALERAAGGLLVLSVLGVHTQDPTSGDFSLSAPQALRIGAGRFEGRQRATISGNLFDLLRRDDLAFVAFEGETTLGLLTRCRVHPA